jgi:hypothetical protein
MLQNFKKLFNNSESGESLDVSVLAAWAEQKGFTLKRVRDAFGFVVDGTLEGQALRIEWGAPHRAYLTEPELRFRMELDVHHELQMLLMSSPLMAQLEKQVFEQFTQGMQTQIDASTPEEMRWLAIFPKVNLSSFKNLRSEYGLVSSAPKVAATWLTGAIAQNLEQGMAAGGWLSSRSQGRSQDDLTPSGGLARNDGIGGTLSNRPPLVLMVLGSRIYLRTCMTLPQAKVIDGAFKLFEASVTQLRRMVSAQIGVSGDWPTTSSIAWQTSGSDESNGGAF